MVVLEADRSQSAVAQSDDGGGAGVMALGLVAVVVVQQPHPRGQRGRHIHHTFPGGDELLGEQRAGPRGAPHGPQPRCEPARPVQRPLSLVTVGGQLQHRLHPLVPVEHRGRM